MTFPNFHYNTNQEAPFTIFVEHPDKTRDGHWRPAALVWLTPSLRTSGFLLALPPEELQSFLLLLTFITADGRIAPITPQLAVAFGQSEAKTRARLERLLKTQWLGQPIITKQQTGVGGESYAPVHGLLPFREETNREPSQVVYRAAPREAIIEHSRRSYARPRAEVEREIEQFLSKSRLAPPPTKSKKLFKPPMTYQEPTSQPSPQDEASNQLRDAMIRAGLDAEQADVILAEHDPIRIQRQLTWLPYRGARNPTGLLLAAIRGDYEAPPAVWHRPRLSTLPPSESLGETPLETVASDTTGLDTSHVE